MTPLSNHAVVEGLLKGEPECERIVRSWCLAAATYKVRDSGIEARDLASETFVNLYEALISGRYRGEGIKSYIQAICEFKFRDRLKLLKRYPDTNQESLNEIPAETRSAEEAARRILLRDLLTKALGALSEEHHRIVIDRQKGIDYETLAKQYRVAANVLRKRHFEAMKRLKAWLEKHRKP